MSRLLDCCVTFILLLIRAEAVFSSQVSVSTYFLRKQAKYPRDCTEARNYCDDQSLSGVFVIQPDGCHAPFEVYCDNEVESGGWTVIQRRRDGAFSFQRNWMEYRLGFGFVAQEFYVGHEKLSFLTNQKKYELRVDFTTAEGVSYNFMYDSFRISDEFSNYTLVSVGKYSGTTNLTTTEPMDCFDVYQRGNIASGVYSIKPTTWKGPPFNVYCNMAHGGGWTVFQRRVDGSVNFAVGWEDYKDGFGSPEHEIWLGNEKIFSLTNQRRYQLRIDFVNKYGYRYYAKYSFFRVSNENSNYRLTIENYNDGNAGDSLTSYNNNQDFSTRDQDNDHSSYDFAVGHNGWWWGGDDHLFKDNSNLNGNYSFHIFWDTLPSVRPIYYTEMKIRHVDL